jgi:adenosylhomocysteine nucleosidase
LVPCQWVLLSLMAILYVASEAAELKPLAGLLTGLRKLKWPLDYAYEGILDGRRIMLAANGAGPKLAARAVETAIRAVSAADLSSSRLEAVVSTGYCGALDPALPRSQIVVATQVLDLATNQRFDCINVNSEVGTVSGLVLSQDRVVQEAAEKSRLYNEFGAVAVEMEAAGVAARAQRAGLAFCCIRVVSDRADESFMVDFNRMRTTDGRIARGKIIRHAVTRLHVVPSLFRLQRRSDDAARVLGDFLVSCRINSGANSLPVH